MKKFLKIVFSLLMVFLIISVFSSLSFQKQINIRPLPSCYKKGVYHVHSSFSDGYDGIEEITRAANRRNLDFVILSDHGRPNRQAEDASGWYNDVLLIGASEFSLNEGHLAAAGYSVPTYIFPPEAQEAVDEINRDQGFSFVSHPFDRKIPWTGWQVHGFSGIEILSLYKLAKKVSIFKAAVFPLQYPLNSAYALTSLITYPQKELSSWDALNKKGRYYGIYALDAHAQLAVSKKFQLNFPSYAAMFDILNIYVKVENELEKDPRQAAKTIISTIRRGNFFNTVESLASANGFEFYYLEKDGRPVDMGGDAQAIGGTMVLKLPFNFATDIVVKKDGETFKTISANSRQTVAIPVSQSGVYRAEISLSAGRFRNLPWILANPIFVAKKFPEKKSLPAAPRLILAAAENYFQVEKNSRSAARIYSEKSPGGRAVTRFTFTLRQETPSQADFWVALARREKLDFSTYQGFVFEVRGSRRMRFWLQFRTLTDNQEASYQHSFLVETDWRQIVIPFAACKRLSGSEDSPNLARLSAIFFLIDNGNAFSGWQGEISLRQIGLY